MLLLSACQPKAPAAPPPDNSALLARIDSLATAVLHAQVSANPELGTEWGLPNAANGRIRENSPTGIRIAQS